jgi:hypothetical protein
MGTWAIQVCLKATMIRWHEARPGSNAPAMAQSRASQPADHFEVNLEAAEFSGSFAYAPPGFALPGSCESTAISRQPSRLARCVSRLPLVNQHTDELLEICSVGRAASR